MEWVCAKLIFGFIRWFVCWYFDCFLFHSIYGGRGKPILELWVEQEKGESFSKTKISEHKIEEEIVEKHGLVDQPLIGWRVYSFQFALLLGNIGQKTGKLIKVSLRLVCDDSAENYGEFRYYGNMYKEPFMVLLKQNENIGEWTKIRIFTGENIFRSNENLVVYSRKASEEVTREWLDEIGKFELFVPLRVEKEKEANIKIECSVQGDGSDLQHQSFQIVFG